ncbi:50S ribosomal protein L1 [Striga asiatica]|uniref:CL1 n=1 Tax=Striga asiatica TaxID=4170 RepID=A0A5A7P8Z2_STRAF|nr:50S ribosomal protein L1 [Striga asiatica]
MAAFKRLLSPTARRCISGESPLPPRHLVSLLRRHFSTEPQPSPNPEPNADPKVANSRQPINIQTVSYAARPKPQPTEENLEKPPPETQTSPPDSQDPVNRETRSWSRDEMRYMKDAPMITPVSYPTRVAPLPEYTKRGEEGTADGNEGLERERKKIEEFRRHGVSAYARLEEEDVALPFPKPIKEENTDRNSKKKGKVIYDLKEAIQLVKVGSFVFLSHPFCLFCWFYQNPRCICSFQLDKVNLGMGLVGISIVQAGAKKTFDETLEAHVRMSPDLRRTDLKLAGFVCLPHGFGKTHRVAVFAEGAAADEARDAGADIVGGQELVENIRTGQIKVDFDKCIATPSMMEHVKKLSKYLKQLMPDTKKGTLTNDITRTVKEAKVPSIRFKKDKTAIVHVGLGKLSFTEDALRDNIGAFVNALLLAKPAGLKKSSKYAGYVDAFHICSTMGPSFPISIQSLSMAADRYSRSQLR